MKKTAVLTICTIATLFIEVTQCKSFKHFPIVSREEWGAKQPILVDDMKSPVSYVVIHHSYIPPACHSPADCAASMRTMQHMHQVTNGWNDIGYSFAVGGDGRTYEGRGWSAVGAHAPGYNNQSIGICVIGDWRNELPPEPQLSALKDLLKYGIQMGHIQKKFNLLGHREVRNTECPGDTLFTLVKRWRNQDHTYKEDEECECEDSKNDVE